MKHQKDKGKKSASKKKLWRNTGKESSTFSLSEFWNERKDVFKFLGVFLILMVVLFALSATELFELIREPLTHVYASLGSAILNILSYDTLCDGDIIRAANFAINIEAGCDGIAPMILFWTTIVVFPVSWVYKWKGLLYGTIFLFLLNLVRVITLFLTGLHARHLFYFMHVELWQILFIAMTIFTWLYWYRWTQKKMHLDNAH